jgi:Gas vesicle synthesis protein GvpL/GvpF
MSSYVYGVIRAADVPDWRGIDGIGGARVHAVVEGDLAALVSELPEDVTPGKPQDLEAHRRLLAHAIEHMTVVPLRFGMVMDDEDVVRERLLAAHADELEELLDKLDGHVQMSVRALYAEDALLQAAIGNDEEIARRSAAIAGMDEVESRPERIALGELVAKAVEERRARDEEILLERLRPLARDVRVSEPGSERVALEAQLLVPRERRPALDAAISELGPALEGYLALRYVGPLPPYSFSELELESGVSGGR